MLHPNICSESYKVDVYLPRIYLYLSFYLVANYLEKGCCLDLHYTNDVSFFMHCIINNISFCKTSSFLSPFCARDVFTQSPDRNDFQHAQLPRYLSGNILKPLCTLVPRLCNCCSGSLSPEGSPALLAL